MAFKVKDPPAKLRDEPRADSPSTASAALATDLLEKVADAPVAGWWKVRVVTPGEVLREGFILAERLVEAEQSDAIDREAFFKQLHFAARHYGSNRDFLYAVAFAESGMRNIKSFGSAAFGPFQFMPTTWSAMVAKHPDSGVTEADIRVPSRQALFGAIYASTAHRALTDVLGDFPTGEQLYLAHFLGTAGATAVLKAKRAEAIDVPLRKFYSKTQVGPGHVDAILSANAGLLLDGTRVRKVSEVLGELRKRLTAGLNEAARLADKLAADLDGPGDPPSQPDAASPPWLNVARRELAKGIKEAPPGDSNKQIEKYFDATTFGKTTDKTPWCAAFVSWCMAQSEKPKLIERNVRSAWAPAWSTWGQSVGRPALGALALVHSPTTRIGHVAFVAAEAATTVTLLGGNQSDAVNETPFRKSDIVDYRWLDWN